MLLPFADSVRLQLCAILLAGVGAITASAARADATLRVLVLDASRAATCGQHALDFLTSPSFEVARTALLDPANFGPGGVVSQQIEIEAVPEFTPSSLGRAEIVVITSLRRNGEDGNALSPMEQALLIEFAEQGGGILVLWDDGTRELGPHLGATAAPFYRQEGCDENMMHGVPTIGPFGNVFGCVVDGRRGQAMIFGTGLPVVSNGVGLRHFRGHGRIIIINDDEWIRNSVSGLDCDLPSITERKQFFFLNCVDYVAPRSTLSNPCVGFMTITQQPGLGMVCAAQPTVWSVSADGLGPIEYQWQRRLPSWEWVALADGPLVLADGESVEVSGSRTPNLSIRGLFESPASAQLVRCVVTNPCRFLATEPFALTVCPGDYDCSGGIDGDDLGAFFRDWQRGNADVDRSGGTDGDDITYFYYRWGWGC